MSDQDVVTGMILCAAISLWMLAIVTSQPYGVLVL